MAITSVAGRGAGAGAGAGSAAAAIIPDGLGPFETSSAPLTVPDLENKIFNLMRSPGLSSFYWGLKKDDLWKLLFMERDKISDGKMSYEADEEGYLQGILQGYLFMLQTREDVLSPDLYKKLHDASVEGVKTKAEPGGVSKGFRVFKDGKEGFYLDWRDDEGHVKTVSAKGFEELKARWLTYQYEEGKNVYFPLKEALDDPSKTIIMNDARSAIRLKPTRPETCDMNARFVIQMYQDAKRSASTEDEKLRAIARLVQDLDQFHLFADGNIRTTGILLLNRSLIENGLCPCVMRDVNQLDCLSEEEVIASIKEGQSFFRSLLSHGLATASTAERGGLPPWRARLDDIKAPISSLREGLAAMNVLYYDVPSARLRKERLLQIQTDHAPSIKARLASIREGLDDFYRFIPIDAASPVRVLIPEILRIQSEVDALAEICNDWMKTDDASNLQRNRRTLSEALALLERPPGSVGEGAISNKEALGFVIEALEELVSLSMSLSAEELRARLSSDLSYFDTHSSGWKFAGSTILQRVYFHVYDIAHDEDPAIGGDRWGEFHCFDVKERLLLALQLTREDLSRFSLEA